MRYCKSAISILLLCCCLLLLWGCGADKAAITQEAEPWVIYQGIVIGQDDLDTVKAALGEPKQITEYKEFHTFRYNGFFVHFYNETCNEIGITGVDAPALKNEIQIGSSLADVLNKCPAVPEEIEVVQGILPDGLGKGLVEEAKAYLVSSYLDEDHTMLESKMLLLLLPGDYFIDIDISPTDDIVENIYIQAPSR